VYVVIAKVTTMFQLQILLQPVVLVLFLQLVILVPLDITWLPPNVLLVMMLTVILVLPT